MQVDFYHLARSPLETVLPRIAERVLASGERLLIVAGEAALAERLDQILWTYAPESFLPHGRADADGAAEQPILIAADAEPANAARTIALADGVWRDEALAFDRTFYLFGDDRLEPARAAWRALGERDEVVRNYWKQEDGGWTKAG